VNRNAVSFLMVVLMSAAATGAFAAPRPKLELVGSLDPARYAGLWYEIARFQHGFEKDLVGVTAEYSLRPDGRIDVLNSGFKKTLDGKRSSVKALAWRPDEARPGALKVRFFGLFASDYLVFGLDDRDYSWALVGDDSRNYLWFLSRTPTAGAEAISKMRAIAEAQGYDLSRLYEVPQIAP
jgi:apolipoprotein D and lipocalin family protein